MKARAFLLAVVLSISGCGSIFGGPTATVKKFMEAAQKGDANTMTSLFSSRAIKRDGIVKISANNKNFAELSQRSNERSGYRMNNIAEIKVGDDARVGFHYQNEDKTDSVRMVFALTRENGTWKIDNIGGSELEEEADITSPAVKDPPLPRAEQVETPPELGSSPLPGLPEAPALTTPPSPISGGVLNAKAITFPKPAYPPLARAAKASGTVVVQVVVDENGNVISATAVSGHPLLRATAVAAARAAKFTPTKLEGQPVQVKGVLNYNFEAP